MASTPSVSETVASKKHPAVGETDLKDAVLIVVDFQNDFCLEGAPLQVHNALSLTTPINTLLTLPFKLKIATQDWHPENHISLASNHPGKPSIVPLANPLNPREILPTQLWPNHCIQETRGAELVASLQTAPLTHFIKKGQDARVEMFSAFRDRFRDPIVSQSDLEQTLRDANVKRVYIVGVAADFCVRYTALDAAELGFETWVVPEGTAAIDEEALVNEVYPGYARAGVGLVSYERLMQERQQVGQADHAEHPSSHEW